MSYRYIPAWSWSGLVLDKENIEHEYQGLPVITYKVNEDLGMSKRPSSYSIRQLDIGVTFTPSWQFH